MHYRQTFLKEARRGLGLLELDSQAVESRHVGVELDPGTSARAAGALNPEPSLQP